jgi:hypothetical protein
MTSRLRAAASVAALAVIGSGVAGVAYADSASTKQPTSASAASATAARHHPILRRMLHGEFVLKARKGTVTVDLQQGRITSVTPTALTVRSSDGVTDDYVLTSATKIRSYGKALKASDLATGDHVWVVALDHSGTLTARSIRGVRGASGAG